MSLDAGIQSNRFPLLLRILLFLLVALTAASLAFYSRNLFLADRAVRSGQTVEDFTGALKHDPDNADIWWLRGRLYHYSVERTDLSRAIHDYRKALELNPRLALAWIDLADALEQKKLYDEAEKAVERAFDMRPYSPLIRWQAGNFFLRRKNLSKMYECFMAACRYDPSKLGIAMETAWKIDPEKEKILEKLVPDDFRSNFRYMDFLAARSEPDLAMAAWQRCLKNRLPEDVHLKPSMLFRFIDQLLSDGRMPEALKIWSDVLSMARTGLSDARYTAYDRAERLNEPQNLVWNESFENEILGGGLDWRYPEMPEILFRADTRNRLKGLKSLEIIFQGTNISSGHLSQIVPIPFPGRYILDFYFKTDGLTTDQLPYMALSGFPESAGATARSEFFPSTADWTRLSVPFEVAEGCGAVRLSLRRDRSSKLNSGIKGVLWLDGFSIQPDKPVTVLPF